MTKCDQLPQLSAEVVKLWELGAESCLGQNDIATFRFLSEQSSRTSRNKKTELKSLVECLWNVQPQEVDISRIHADISQEEFNNTFALPGRPCMITGCCHDQDGVAWPALKTWSTSEELASARGELPLKITTMKGDAASARPLHVKLKHFLAYAEQDSGGADFPFYCFEDDLSGAASVLWEDFEVPRLFRDDCYNVSSAARHVFPRHTFFIAGGARTGTPVHTDPNCTSAWNTLLCGTKRWVLFPPCSEESLLRGLGVGEGESIRGEHCPPAKIWEYVVDAMSDGRGERLGMVTCLQQSGETIFVPSGWWHAILNLDTTVAITGNQLLPSCLHAAWDEMAWPTPMLNRFARECCDKWPQIWEGGNKDLLHVLRSEEGGGDGEGREGGWERELVAGREAPAPGQYLIIINTETVLRATPQGALDCDSMLLLQDLISFFGAEIVLSDPARASKAYRDQLTAEFARWGVSFQRWTTGAQLQGGRSSSVLHFITSLPEPPTAWCALDGERLGGKETMMMQLLEQQSVASRQGLSATAARAALDILLDPDDG